MKKVFLSLPMNGRTNEAIMDTMSRMAKTAEALLGEEVEIIDTFLEGADYKNKPVACLGESIKRMQGADLFLKLNNYNCYSRGCEIEEKVAYSYGIPVIEILDATNLITPDIKSEGEKNEL